jgi:hypothetical protein
MGCGKDYRVTNVKSEIVPIDDGFRLISHDIDHCGWWLRFSHFPIKWVAQSRSYEWTSEQYRPGIWYPCSIGKFRIDHMVDNDCVSDITFVFDRRWTSGNTVFVVWDTSVGRYYVLNK